MPVNEGAASPLSRWCSHSRPINHSNNLFAALGLHHLMIVGCIAERCRSDVAALIPTLSGRSYYLVSFLYCIFVVPIRLFIFIILIIVLLFNELFSILEQACYCVLLIFTLFSIMNNSRMTSIYCTFMHFVEAIAGNIWQDSTIRLVTPRTKCKCASTSGSCRQGECYKLVERFLYDQLNITCDCFRKHVANRMALAREQDACKTFLEQANRVTACKYLWRPSLLKTFADEGCGVFNDDVLERCYDMDRLMWTTVRLVTEMENSTPPISLGNATASPQQKFVKSTANATTSPQQNPASGQAPDEDKLVDISITRDDLIEIASVPIDAPDRLFEMQELRFAFLKNLARVGSGSVISYTPVLILKKFLMLVVIVLQILFASKTYEDDRILGLSIMVSVIILNLLYSLRDSVTEEDLGGPDSRVARMLAVDSMSVGLNLIRYSNKGTSWTRHNGFGSVQVGAIDVLENLLHNRSLVMGQETVSLSRQGTSMIMGKIHGRGKLLRVSEWKKASQSRVLEATKSPMPSLDTMIGA